MDFTFSIYSTLLKSLFSKGNADANFKNHLLNKHLTASIILRHDVDLLPGNSLAFAQIQQSMGISGSYYFRIVPESFDKNIIKQIADLGHEIGYHYEDMDLTKGNVDKAWDSFRRNLDEFRKITTIETVCMHGSPRSRYDNRDLWLKYDYKSLGIIGEPYYDVDFNQLFYLTDTGRRWDGWKVSVRDKVPQQEAWIKQGLAYHSTNDIIRAIQNKSFPEKVMFTFHPQRWTNNPILWAKELVMQNAKNAVKKVLINK